MALSTTVFFAVFLAAFVALGVYSSSRAKSTSEDYLLASRSVNPWLAALSAVATNNSGFMFMGLIGETFQHGISAAWLMVGWIGGDWLAFTFVHKRVRSESERTGSTSVPGFLAGESRAGYPVAVVAGLITLVFLGLYASAQLVAGGKALTVVSGLPVGVGVAIGAVMVAAYCFSGGIRASIWTDAAQSVVMMVAMGLILALALLAVGGVGPMWERLAAIDTGSAPGLTELSPANLHFGLIGYVVGWFGAGFGVIGQPHVMIRAMALDSAENIGTMRRIYTTWYVVFTAACIAVGLAARVLLDGQAAPGYDHERAMIDLAVALELAPILIGLLLAGLFAATISTADSQILSCSAALTQDLFPRWGRSYRNVKIATLAVTTFALGLALWGGSVFSAVTLAWGTLAAGLGPLMLVRAMRWRVSSSVALVTMVVGIGATLGWRFVLGWGSSVYEAFPGMVLGFAVYLILAYSVLGGPRRRNQP